MVSKLGCWGDFSIQLSTLRQNIRRARNKYIPKCGPCLHGAGWDFLLDLRICPFLDDFYSDPTNVRIQCSKCSKYRVIRVSSFRKVFEKHASDPSWKPICAACSHLDHFSASGTDLNEHASPGLTHPIKGRMFVNCVMCGGVHDTSTRAIMNSIRKARIYGHKYEYKCFHCSSSGPNYVSMRELESVILPVETTKMFGHMPKSRTDNICVSCETCKRISSIRFDSLLRNSYISRKDGRDSLYQCFSCSLSRPEVVEAQAIARSLQRKQGVRSGIEIITAQILDSLDLEYISEYRLGPYLFDFYIPNHNVLIEVQGEYWHNIHKNIKNDLSKKSYVEQNHPDKRIIYLEESSFVDPKNVSYFLSSQLSTKLKVVDFELDSVVFSVASANKQQNSRNPEWEDFLNSFDCSRSRRSVKFCFEARIGNTLVGVAKYSCAPRNGISRYLNLPYNEILELDQVCIHPSYENRGLQNLIVLKSLENLSLSRPSTVILVRGETPHSSLVNSLNTASKQILNIQNALGYFVLKFCS